MAKHSQQLFDRTLNATSLDRVDEDYRNRLRTMLSVDDLVDGVLSRIDTMGMLVRPDFTGRSQICFVTDIP